VESGFPSENATPQKCPSGFCFQLVRNGSSATIAMMPRYVSVENGVPPVEQSA
jgi:hypothetical protein